MARCLMQRKRQMQETRRLSYVSDKHIHYTKILGRVWRSGVSIITATFSAQLFFLNPPFPILLFGVWVEPAGIL
jgi:hypothetical protein